MNIGPQVWLESNSFLPIEGEEEETNPGILGKAYAHWLADELRRSGEPVADIIGEDWGWCVMLRYKPYRIFIACASGKGEHPSKPALSEWAAFVVAEPSLLQRMFSRVDPAPEIQRLTEWLQGAAVRAPGCKRVWLEASGT